MPCVKAQGCAQQYAQCFACSVVCSEVHSALRMIIADKFRKQAAARISA